MKYAFLRILIHQSIKLGQMETITSSSIERGVAMKVQEQKDYDNLFKKIKSQPPFVSEYVTYKRSENVSPSSLLEYTRDFDRFFTWLADQKAISSNKGIQIEHLKKLNVNDILEYLEYLRFQENMMERSVSRKIHSLRSLFNYLHDIAEDHDGEPMLCRKVFMYVLL